MLGSTSPYTLQALHSRRRESNKTRPQNGRFTVGSGIRFAEVHPMQAEKIEKVWNSTNEIQNQSKTHGVYTHSHFKGCWEGEWSIFKRVWMNIYLRIGGILVIEDIEGKMTDDHPQVQEV